MYTFTDDIYIIIYIRLQSSHRHCQVLDVELFPEFHAIFNFEEITEAVDSAYVFYALAFFEVGCHHWFTICVRSLLRTMIFRRWTCPRCRSWVYSLFRFFFQGEMGSIEYHSHLWIYNICILYMDANGYTAYTSTYTISLFIISPWFSGWKFQFAKVFQFRRGTPLAFEKSASKMPKNESLASRYGGNFTLCSRAQLWSFYRWSNVEVLKMMTCRNFRAKKSKRFCRMKVMLGSPGCCCILYPNIIYTRSWQWHTRYVQEWFQERSSSRILNWRSSWDAAGFSQCDSNDSLLIISRGHLTQHCFDPRWFFPL